MQTQNIQPGLYIQELPRLTVEDQKEVVLLQNMGLQNYEIQYLVHLKQKERLREKWEHNKH